MMYYSHPCHSITSSATLFLYVLFPRNNRRLIVGIRLTIQQVHICDKAHIVGLHVSKEVRHCV